MNNFFVFLHAGRSAAGIFITDVITFIVVAIILYALIFLIKSKIKTLRSKTAERLDPVWMDEDKYSETEEDFRVYNAICAKE